MQEINEGIVEEGQTGNQDTDIKEIIFWIEMENIWLPCSVI
jgi:hypothetical protein